MPPWAAGWSIAWAMARGGGLAWLVPDLDRFFRKSVAGFGENPFRPHGRQRALSRESKLVEVAGVEPTASLVRSCVNFSHFAAFPFLNPTLFHKDVSGAFGVLIRFLGDSFQPIRPRRFQQRFLRVR